MAFIGDGLKLMLVGMGMVFVFLTVMIFWMQFSSYLSGKFAHLLPDDEKAAPKKAAKRPAPAAPAPAAVPAAASGNPLLAAVVSAAVQAYRRDRGML
jgi:sodium pump decarboxylase gamma subunit